MQVVVRSNRTAPTINRNPWQRACRGFFDFLTRTFLVSEQVDNKNAGDVMKKTKKRSPLTGRPLRNPGQSIDEQIQDLRTDKLLLPMMIAAMLVAFAAIEWWRYYVPQPPRPILVTIMAVFAIIWVGIRIRQFRPRLLAQEDVALVAFHLSRFIRSIGTATA